MGGFSVFAVLTLAADKVLVLLLKALSLTGAGIGIGAAFPPLTPIT